MKKIIKIIITLTVIISSLSPTFAENWYIENILNLDYTIEENNLELSQINYYHFNTVQYKNIYLNMKKVNELLKKWIINNYKNWTYWYYQVNWIIKNHNNFTYNLNQFFFYLKIKESWANYVELNTAIKRSSINVINSYNRIKNLIK